MFGDVPPGDYEIEVKDNCGAVVKLTTSITELATFSPDLNVIQGCLNSNSITINMNAQIPVDRRAYVKLFENDGAGGLGQLVGNLGVGTNRQNELLTFSNVASGDYIIRYDTVLINSGQDREKNYSMVTKTFNPDREYTIPVTVPDYVDATVAVFGTLCDMTDSNSGIVMAEITGGTPVYPLTFALYNDDDTLVASVSPSNPQVVTDPNITSVSWGDVPTGDYYVKTEYECYTVETSVSVNAAQALPDPETNNPDGVCLSDTETILSIFLSDSIWDITWYDETPEVVGTGSSITVNPIATTTYTVSYVLSAGVCPDPVTYTDTITITVFDDPDLSLAVSDIDTCTFEPYAFTISNSEIGFTYEVLDQNGDALVPTLSAEGTGADLILELPSSNLPDSDADYSIYVTNNVSQLCSGSLIDLLTISICNQCTIPIDGNSFSWSYPGGTPSPITQTTIQPPANAGFVFDIWVG